MTMQPINVSAGPTRRFLDRVIPAAALAAVVLAVGHAGLSSSSSNASAQPDGDGEPLLTTPFNAAEQRKAMIDQLRQMNSRLGRLESKLSQPLDVRVKEMPPQQATPSNP